MADELAKVLEIPDAVTAKMTDVTKKIKEIEDASNTMATQVNAAWKTLANGDIDSYLQKLKEVQTASSSSKIAIDSTDITKAATEAEKWADAMQRVVEQASNYAATKTATFAVQQEWNEALKALKLYKEAELRASEMGMAVPQEAQDAIAKVKERVAELEETYGELAKSKKAAWAASDAKLEIQSAERVAKKKQQQIEAEKRLEHTQLTRALKVEAANNRVLILAEKLSREQGKSQHYAGLIAELQRLQDEYKKLGNTKTDAERRGQLEQEMEQVRKSIQSADSSMRGLSNTTRGLFNYADQLSRAFALLFSVSQIRNYIRQIKDVTAEFELQRVALGSLLQSQEKANELFGQITNLAVRSPFTIKELNKYTKQLAAYNIQYENLFDTTKMLADVSAGLGMDIGRLILAFGQVKAATVLRGTEVRQFTEAGFGILGELAKYYTELEGKLVSVGDVQDRITKKMVKFADVEEIFKRVTSAGGMFYNMQEKMADTLYGKWSNLTDRIDLMLNEIGQNNMGILNFLVDVSAGLADNWEAVAVALQLAIPALISFKVQSAMAAKGLTWIGEQSIFATVSVKGLGAAFKSALGPVGLLLIALEAGYAIFNYLADATERNNEALKDYNRNVATLTKTQRAFADIEQMERKANETDKDFAKRQYDAKLASLISLREELAKMGFDEENLPDISLVTSDNIDQQINDLQKAGKAYVDFSHKFRDVIGNMANGVEWLGVLGENVKSDAEDLVRSASKMNASVSVDVENIKNAFLAVKDQIEPDTFNRLFEGLTQKEGEDAIQYAERLKKILEELSQPYSPLTQSLGMDAKYVKQWASDALSTVEGFRDDIKEMEFEADKFTDKLIKNYYGSRERMQEDAQSNPIAFVTAIRDELARQQIDGFAQDVMAKKIVIDLIPKFDWSNMSGTPQLAQWKKDLLAMRSLEGLITKEDLENIASFDEYVSSLRSETKKAKEENERYGNTIKDNQGEAAKQYKEAQDNNAETIKANEAIAKALGINLDLTKKEQKQAKTRNDYLKESVSLIEKMGKEYDDALDSMGKTAAKTDISTRYSSLLSDLADKAGMDGTAFVANLSFDTSGIISALQKVADAAAKAGATEAEQAAREAIAKIQGEDVKIEVKANVEGFERELDNVLAQYQLGKELSKLGLGKELTESLFNFESIDISGVKDFITQFKILHTEVNGEMGKEYKEAYEKALKEVANLENKELQERLKSYQKYLKQSMSDAVAIKLEEARQLDEINKMEIDAAAKAQLREGVKRETSEKYDKAKWEEFKDSDMYIRMFEDLEYASTASLNTMKSKLMELKESLKDLSPEQLKEITRIYTQIDEELIKRNPFKSLAEAKKEIDDMEKKGRTPEVLNAEIEANETQLSQLNSEIEMYSHLLGLKMSNNDQAAVEYALANELFDQYQKTDEELMALIKTKREAAKPIQLKVKAAVTDLGKYKDLIKSYQSGIDKTKEWEQIINDLMNSSRALFEALGGEADSIGGIFLDLGMNMVNMVFQAIQFSMQLKIMKAQAEALGVAMNTAMGPIGWISMALSAVASIASAIFQAHDKSKERRIERELDLIDELQRSYEQLEEAIDSAYSSSTYDQAQDDAIANLEAQNKALERAQAAERDKKKTDQDRIDEWEQQKLDNLEKIAELERQAIEAYGGFGSDDNIKSAAEDFVSAWLDAFNETGNGLDALSDKMDEWLNNAIQKQLLMRLSEQYITPLLSQFDQMFEETSDMGRQMSQAELEAWKKIYEKNSKEFDEKAKAYLNALDIKPTGAESALSGLQRGIEGVTETTAQALEALLNSMRYYVNDSNNLLRQFYMSFISADETMNPMLYELKQHTTLLNAIHSLLNSTTKMTNNNGRALKVLMM